MKELQELSFVNIHLRLAKLTPSIAFLRSHRIQTTKFTNCERTSSSHTCQCTKTNLILPLLSYLSETSIKVYIFLVTFEVFCYLTTQHWNGFFHYKYCSHHFLFNGTTFYQTGSAVEACISASKQQLSLFYHSQFSKFLPSAYVTQYYAVFFQYLPY